MNKKLLEAIATMVGTVIGAGILGIPFVIAQAGFWTGMINIFFLGSISLLLYLYLGEVALRTKGLHQLTGYAEKYLGKIGKTLMTFSMIFGIYGALTAYIIGEGLALSTIFGGNPILYSLIFFGLGSFIIYKGMDKVAESEMYMIPFIIIIVVLIAVLAFVHIDPANLTTFDISKIFIPYGVVLFAFLGSTAIPEMEIELKNHEKHMKKAIILGMLIPMAIYIIFVISVVGVSGLGTTEIATIGLGNVIGPYMLILGNLFAAITMATSFLALGLALVQMYQYDYKMKKNYAWALTCFVPLIIAFAGFTSFSKALNLSGIIAGGLAGILIVLMAMKAKTKGNRKPEYTMPINWLVVSLFIAIFAGGAGYYLWTLL